MSEDRLIQFMHEGEQYELRYRDSDHSYRIRAEGGNWQRYVNNSTVAKVSYDDPSGLMEYARNEALAGRDHNETTKAAQECGTAAHDQLEALAVHKKALDLSGQPERVRGALQAVAKWYLDMDPKFVANEVIVCSPELRVAGRFDFLCEVNGELVLGDLKSSEKTWDHFRRFKAKASYAQLAGYAITYRTMYADCPQPTSRYILHISTSGEYDWERDRAPELSDRRFLSKLETYRLDAEWDKADKAVAKEQLRLAA